jgi:hypothetical protein
MSLSKSLLSVLFPFVLSVNWLFGVSEITLVSPNFGPVAGGETVAITGTGFFGVSEVKFGPTLGTVVTRSDTQITVQTPQSVIVILSQFHQTERMCFQPLRVKVRLA